MSCCTAHVRFWGNSGHDCLRESAFAVAIGGKADIEPDSLVPLQAICLSRYDRSCLSVGGRIEKARLHMFTWRHRGLAARRSRTTK